MKLKTKGFEEHQIANLTSIPPMEISRIFNDEKVAAAIAKENYEKKIPIMKDVVGMGLEVIKNCLIEMMDPEIRKGMVKNVKDLATLQGVVQDLSMLLRLEEGKSTENISISKRSYQETRFAIQELKKIDPVFDYPELPEKIVEDS